MIYVIIIKIVIIICLCLLILFWFEDILSLNTKPQIIALK